MEPASENQSAHEDGSSARSASTVRVALRRAGTRAAAESGQTLVEFAVVLVALCLLVFGITQFGQAFNVANDETHLAEMAARYAAVNYNPGSANGLTFVQWVMRQGGTSFAKNGQISICFPNGTSNVGDPVKVVAKSSVFSFQPLTALASLAKSVGIPAQITIQGQAVMRLEAPPSMYAGGAC